MSLPSQHIRDQNSLRAFNHPTLLPTSSRRSRHTTSRPRSFIHKPLLAHSPSNYSHSKKLHPFFIRIPSSALIISTIALAFFVLGIIVSSNISTALVSPRATGILSSIPRDQLTSASSLSVLYPTSNLTSPNLTNSKQSNNTREVNNSNQLSSIPTPRTPNSSQFDFSQDKQNQTNLKTDSLTSATETGVISPSAASNSVITLKPVSIEKIYGRISWIRSWPLAPHLDDTHVLPLAKALKFDNHTMLNYFHMHKTGGVTLKSEVMAVVNNPKNKAIASRRGYGLKYAETCYEVDEQSQNALIEATWRCDFGKLKNMSNLELAAVNIVMGHQYWDEGMDELFSKSRKIRYFSIFRHPLSRKLSFFYHFFVRNLGRDEKKVGKDEIIKFLLGEEMPDDASTRDAGPNYYASRMMSDGRSGFSGYRYVLSPQQSEDTITNVFSKLQNSYALVGLQIQHEASQCMLEKLIQVFAHGRGIDDLVGTPKLSFNTAKLNSGGYPWTSKKIWKGMTSEQRKQYKEVERVDLAIYAKAVERFKDNVKLYSCEDQVKEEAFDEDVFE